MCLGTLLALREQRTQFTVAFICQLSHVACGTFSLQLSSCTFKCHQPFKAHWTFCLFYEELWIPSATINWTDFFVPPVFLALCLFFPHPLCPLPPTWPRQIVCPVGQPHSSSWPLTCWWSCSCMVPARLCTSFFPFSLFSQLPASLPLSLVFPSLCLFLFDSPGFSDLPHLSLNENFHTSH